MVSFVVQWFWRLTAVRRRCMKLSAYDFTRVNRYLLLPAAGRGSLACGVHSRRLHIDRLASGHHRAPASVIVDVHGGRWPLSGMEQACRSPFYYVVEQATAWAEGRP